MDNFIDLPNDYIYGGDLPFIFISYARKDSKTVKPIVEELCRRNYRVWLDNGISGGHNWMGVLTERLKKCAAVLFFVSDTSAASDNCNKEISISIENKKPIIPIFLQATVELKPELEYALAGRNNIYKHKYKIVPALVDKICETDVISTCNKSEDELISDEERRKANRKRLIQSKIHNLKRALYRGRKLIITATLLIVAALFITVWLPSILYNNAQELLDNGEYAQAYKRFSLLGDYKDANAVADKLLAEHKMLVHLDAKVGDVITFGKYEQDNNWSNGFEDIEWIVLENTGKELLLVSKYALDCKPYHKTNQMVDWNGSFLRSWLNSGFYNAAFSDADKKAIVLTEHVTIDNPDYDQPGGYDTQDYLFMLNVAQVRTHEVFRHDRRCEATAYARALGAYVNGSGYSWWWLCTPGEYLSKAAGVTAEGEISSSGDTVTISDNVVRPALRLNLES